MWGGLTTPAELRASPTSPRSTGADGEDDRRPAHRPARHQEGRPARKSGPTSACHGLRPRLRQEHPHGEDLRRRRALPLRHAEVDGMGVKLERCCSACGAPHKVKLAVSGCPRNCAEAGIKDVGVIGVDSGYELYVAGNGGIKTEVAQFLCKVKTRRGGLEYSGAFLQLYREEGFYLERTCTTSPASASTTSRRRWSTIRRGARNCTSACCSPCRTTKTRGRQAVQKPAGAARVRGHRGSRKSRQPRP
jgi:nitrite reductase (NADH) large subunit